MADPFASRFVNILDSQGYEPSALSLDHEVLKQQNEQSNQELQRLRALLEAHDISWKPSVPEPEDPSTKAKLPLEVHIQIMKHALKSQTIIIDPFFGLCKNNITKEELKTRGGRTNITIGLLGVCKDFYEEGTRLLVMQNSFIFTQVAALQNFAKYPVASRSTVNHINIRVVGRYYGSRPGLTTLKNGFYHEQARKLEVNVLPLPVGMKYQKPLEGYCWSQVADFLEALVVLECHSSPKTCSKLLPGLSSLRIDCVNFHPYLPFPKDRITDLLKAHYGGIVNELMITGSEREGGSVMFDENGNPYSEIGADGKHFEEVNFGTLLADGGLLIYTPCCEFISTGSGVRSLRSFAHKLRVLRGDTEAALRKPLGSTQHPIGGFPPDSEYPEEETISKWTTSYYGKPNSWYEFDRKTGIPMNEAELALDGKTWGLR